jgi:hypothetical protein
MICTPYFQYSCGLWIRDLQKNMPDEFIDKISAKLQQTGYVIELDPIMAGVQGLLYACSPAPFQLGFARVEDHFLFLDWENAVFGRLDLLIDVYKNFSKSVNQYFKVPHGLRLRIPNLAVIALSSNEFPEEIIQYTRRNYQNPWYGGECGQIILADTGKKKIFHHPRPGVHQSGGIPLGHTLDVLLDICIKSF